MSIEKESREDRFYFRRAQHINQTSKGVFKKVLEHFKTVKERSNQQSGLGVFGAQHTNSIQKKAF